MTLESTDKPATMSHLFPFTFDKEGPVDAETFLSVTPSTATILKSNTFVDDLARHSTVIMGRLLQGIEVTAPSGLEGHVWQQEAVENTNDGYDEDYEEHQSDNDDEPVAKNSVWSRTETKVGDSFILWKKDIAPPATDPRIHALESWITIADTIHTPIPIKH
ncbi:hypothetical protein [Absidia glauca]|uniref:Uncharacterized protein n=1 Tax=Absidia glauca TaxID=4829 RepID=A0A163MX10_ABSGL|nr:hypothetical protein [Absidia glauca]